MAIFFIQIRDLHNDHLVIDGPLFLHLHKSLRIHEGEIVWFADEYRRRYVTRVTHITTRMLRAQILQRIDGPPPRGAQIILAQAILKGDRMNWVIQKATELGVAVIVPLISHRVIVRPASTRMSACQQRWQRIAHDAAQQSERWTIPVITLPCPLADFWNQYKASVCKIILVERDATVGLRTFNFPVSPQEHIVLTIGPEGGWTPEESQTAQNQGFSSVSLGELILRGETATVASISLVQGQLGNLG